MQPSPAKPLASGGDTRERILRVAAALFADKGYHATGMAELERAVGLGRGALYHHITSKEDLLWDINSRYLLELIDAGEELVAADLDPVERLHRLSRRVMASIANHLPELTVCFRETRSVTGERREALLTLHQRYEDVWSATLRAGVKSGQLRSAHTLVVKALLGMHHYSYLWLRPDGPRRPEDIADFFTEFSLRGLGEVPKRVSQRARAATLR
jgi:TetR/AcrR family transcriptional regulator, cholesterol catabolism regulator